ncbi:MAG: 4-hydroxy-tetrahydrodipicolinate reductase [Oscillospiraceae bacterium]|nr:4-hydroxy-tetrahydrodipicolinate reductase [Oscillospiraceae bacterium]
MNLLINGLNGKMGQEVLKQAQMAENFIVVCGVDKINSEVYSFPTYTNPDDIKEKIDVIIDFSIPSGSLSILEFAKTHTIPTVIATTGFSEGELKTIENYSLELPIFKSNNMSYEVSVMADIVAKLAVLLKDSDIEIIDTHHGQKLDSPSGTALILADSINSVLNNEMYYEYNRESKREKRNEKEIGIHSIRGGTVVGKHTVSFLGKNESFEITHTVDSRSVFATGALKAAEFIIKQENGLYSMKDLLL